MTEKKGRFILLLIAIAMSASLVVTSTGLVNVILDSILRPTIVTFEEKDLSIKPTDKQLSFFSCDDLSPEGIEPDSLLKEILVNAMLIDNVDTDDETTRNISISARDVSMVPDDLLLSGNKKDFVNDSCIISERIAEERNLVVGDSIELIIAGVSKKLTVVALTAPDGFFYNDKPESFSMMVPYDYMAKEFDVEGLYNNVTACSKDGDIDKATEAFNKANASLNASELFDEDEIKDQFGSFSSALYAMLIIVVAMSSIIIYSTFKLIITERLTTIGTFLSQGATVGKIKFILRLESLLYGILGAILGNGLGVLALTLITRFMSPLKAYGIYEKVNIKPSYLIIGTIFSIILSLVSSYLPVRKIGKLQVKEVILNDVRVSMHVGYKKFIIGCILLGSSILFYLFGGKLVTKASPVLLVLSLLGTILAYPKVIDLLSGLFSKLFRGKNKSLFFAANNLRTSKILLNNITLIVISILSILSITSAADSLCDVVIDAYANLNCDVEISNISNIRENDTISVADQLIDQLVDIGVKKEDMNVIYSEYGFLYLNEDDTESQTVMYLHGIDLDSYIAYNGYLHLDDEKYKKNFETFRSDPNGIILTKSQVKGTGKKIGDTVFVECNGVRRELTIDAIIDARLYNNGMVGYVSHDTIENQFNVPSANYITFRTDIDMDTFLPKLKPIVRSIGATYITKTKMCDNNMKQNRFMMDGLSIFSYLAIVIAALGIINNVSISFIQRKTEFAVLSSVGMENSLRRRILLIESFTCVTWGMLIAIAYSTIGIPLLGKIMETIGYSFDISLAYSSLPIVYLVSLVVVLMATIPTIFKSRKLSIVQELKYE
ncbi:ABC transporter permease [Anaerosporobacter faecicola]|uniref:ABC transporter permease n=1 Tax=Anaerosporobacter faecicola TaxID=2718714 RepID=UPI001438B0ED|nr:FtsX-like permease family protein [Anaerosporobacter faecicola]